MHSLTIRLSDDIEKRLESLSRRTHRTKTFYVRAALLHYLEDIEDIYDAKSALNEPGNHYSLSDIVNELNLTAEEKKEIGLED